MEERVERKATTITTTSTEYDASTKELGGLTSDTLGFKNYSSPPTSDTILNIQG